MELDELSLVRTELNEIEQVTSIKLLARGVFIPKTAEYTDIEIATENIYRIRGAADWAIIDLLMTARDRYGESYSQLVDLTQISTGTLYNMHMVWRHFPTPDLRKWDLSFSHYQAVAVDYLDYETKSYILQQAYDNGLTRDEVREIVQGYGPNKVIEKSFSKEAFVSRIKGLLMWAKNNNAPDDLLDALEELLKEYIEEK